tara:strand:- start:198 stop:608 length:411 start_codon:yes stop_codon:yes gene_type:complete
MSYQPFITTPIFFAYNSATQTIGTDAVLTLDTSLYAGSLSSNKLTQIQKSTSIADVKYSMSTGGLRSTTIIRDNNTNSTSKGFNLHGSGGGANGVSDELAYATFNAAELNIFCDQKQGLNITMQAECTRLTGVLIS